MRTSHRLAPRRWGTHAHVQSRGRIAVPMFFWGGMAARAMVGWIGHSLESSWVCGAIRRSHDEKKRARSADVIGDREIETGR